MTDLKDAILEAKYMDMIALGDFIVRDCGLPDVDGDGNLMPQATEIAAAVFRWAADAQAAAKAPEMRANGAAREDPGVQQDGDDDKTADAPSVEDKDGRA